MTAKRSTSGFSRALQIGAGALALGLGATAGPARAADEGSALIHAVDAERNVVVLDGESFQVSDRTTLEDVDGNDISVRELPSLEAGASLDDAAARYEAAAGSEARSSRPLLRLRLTGSAPK